ncbi:centrosomal protein of 164 kDa-like [Brachionichthys hirsutus]|uniref:centrosomal protein of 164 kDa-like n=1 Tax=Brachionichthys hirsutus TaxID=412623 RepID=UPI003604C532
MSDLLYEDQRVLEEITEVDFEASEEDILEYASIIGIDPDTEPELLWLAREGLQATLPPGWRAVEDPTKGIYYFNFETGESIWDHPNDLLYSRRVTEERGRAPHAGGAMPKTGKEKKKRKGKRKDRLKTPEVFGQATPALLGHLPPLRGMTHLGRTIVSGAAPGLHSPLGALGVLEPIRTSLGGSQSQGPSSICSSRQEDRASLAGGPCDEADMCCSDSEPSLHESEPARRPPDLDVPRTDPEREDNEDKFRTEERTEPELRDISTARDSSLELSSQRSEVDEDSEKAAPPFHGKTACGVTWLDTRPVYSDGAKEEEQENQEEEQENKEEEQENKEEEQENQEEEQENKEEEQENKEEEQENKEEEQENQEEEQKSQEEEQENKEEEQENQEEADGPPQSADRPDPQPSGPSSSVLPLKPAGSSSRSSSSCSSIAGAKRFGRKKETKEGREEKPPKPGRSEPRNRDDEEDGRERLIREKEERLDSRREALGREEEEERKRLIREKEERMNILREELKRGEAEDKKRLTEEKEERLETRRKELESEEEEQERKLKEENEEKLRALQQRLLSKRSEEEARLTEESEIVLKELQESAPLGKEENDSSPERERLEAQHGEDIQRLRKELEEEKERLRREMEEKVHSLRKEVDVAEETKEFGSRYEQQLAENHKELASIYQERQEEALRDHRSQMDRLREEHEREVQRIRVQHQEEEAALRERLLVALQEKRERLRESHAAQLDELNKQLKEVAAAPHVNKCDFTFPRLVQEREMLKRELETARQENREIKGLLQKAKRERDEAREEEGRLKKSRDEAVEEGGRARKEKEKLMNERKGALEEKLMNERKGAMEEKLIKERKGAMEEKLIKERKGAMEEKLMKERKGALEEGGRARKERDASVEEGRGGEMQRFSRLEQDPVPSAPLRPEPEPGGRAGEAAQPEQSPDVSPDVSHLAADRKVTFAVTESDLSSSVATPNRPVSDQLLEIKKYVQHISGQLDTVMATVPSLAQRTVPELRPTPTSDPFLPGFAPVQPRLQDWTAFVPPPSANSSWSASSALGAAFDPILSSTRRSASAYPPYPTARPDPWTAPRPGETDDQRLQEMLKSSRKWLDKQEKDASILLTRCPSLKYGPVQLGLESNQIRIYRH